VTEAIETIDMHTAGEAVRIVIGGFPPILGTTILQKRAYAKQHLDHLRTFLMAEPRGYFGSNLFRRAFV
jgi:proline racemase